MSKRSKDTPASGSRPTYDPDLDTDDSAEHLAATRTGRTPPTKTAHEQARGEEQVGVQANEAGK